MDRRSTAPSAALCITGTIIAMIFHKIWAIGRLNFILDIYIYLICVLTVIIGLCKYFEGHKIKVFRTAGFKIYGMVTSLFGIAVTKAVITGGHALHLFTGAFIIMAGVIFLLIPI